MPVNCTLRMKMIAVMKKYGTKKAKAFPLHPTQALGGERRYISYYFLTSALDGGEWPASLPGRALAPRKGPPVPIVQEAGWVPETIWTQRLEEKSIHLCRESNLDRPVVQPSKNCNAITT
jgi:hypothetical protein